MANPIPIKCKRVNTTPKAWLASQSICNMLCFNYTIYIYMFNALFYVFYFQYFPCSTIFLLPFLIFYLPLAYFKTIHIFKFSKMKINERAKLT